MDTDDLFSSMQDLDHSAKVDLLAMARLLKVDPPSEDGHLQWLVDWQRARNAAVEAPDGSVERAQHMETAERMSVQIATTPATSREGLIAQILWFEQDMGHYVKGNASPEHDMIFRTLSKSVFNLGS